MYCQFVAGEEVGGDTDGEADAGHLNQEAGGRAPRQLCCIAVTAKHVVPKHNQLDILPR